MSQRMFFDLQCLECNQVEEDWYGRREEVSEHACEVCGEFTWEILLTPPKLVGPRNDKPVVFSNSGVKITSPEQMREYTKRTGHEPIMPDSPAWRAKVDRAYATVDKSVKSKGFAGVEDFRKTVKQRAADKRRIQLDGTKVVK